MVFFTNQEDSNRERKGNMLLISRVDNKNDYDSGPEWHKVGVYRWHKDKVNKQHKDIVYRRHKGWSLQATQGCSLQMTQRRKCTDDKGSQVPSSRSILCDETRQENEGRVGIMGVLLSVSRCCMLVIGWLCASEWV